jgi:hypothetical protein
MVANNTSQYDGTAQPLANKCHDLHEKTKQNTCLLNVANFIDKECHDYDFIGTQENGNWEELNSASNTLSKMGYIVHLTNKGMVKFVTYYNPDRYTLLGGKVGDLIIPSPKEEGRPYQILFFVDKQTKKDILFINVHNSHNNGRTRIKTNFRDIASGFMMKKGEQSINLESNYGNDDITSLIKDKTFYVMMTGDHNDHGNIKESKYWKGIKPFELSNYPNLKNIKLSTNNVEPPFTCCDTTRKKKNGDFRYGDYILISDNLKFIKNNTISTIEYDSDNYPTSDHLPAFVELTFNDNGSTNEKGKQTERQSGNTTEKKEITDNYEPKKINFINYSFK